MRLELTVFASFILIGLMSICSLSVSDLISPANSLNYNDNERLDKHQYVDRMSTRRPGPMDTTLVEIVKSFKNSTGFFKINGTLVNQGAIILTDIQVIKYHKIPSVNDTTLVCYEQYIVNCQYKSIDNQLPSKNVFLTMPPASPETKIN